MGRMDYLRVRKIIVFFASRLVFCKNAKLYSAIIFHKKINRTTLFLKKAADKILPWVEAPILIDFIHYIALQPQP